MMTRFPTFLLAGLGYVLLVFVIPGFWLLRYVSHLVAGWLDMQPTDFLLLAVLHAVLYFGLVGALIWYARIHKLISKDDAEEAPWLRAVLDALSLRGFRWLSIISALVLIAGFFLQFRYGSPTLESLCLVIPVFLGLIDLSIRPVAVPWEDTLPPPRFGQDSIPEEGAGDSKTIALTWNPFLWDEPEAPPGEETFEILKTDVLAASARPRTRDLEAYVENGFCSSVLRVAFRLRTISEENRFGALQEMASVVALVRSIPYALDEETHGVEEYADYPVELLWDERGDCEDHAILAAALLHALGHDVGLFYISLRDCGHVALAYQTGNADGMFSKTASNGLEYFYVETVPVSDTQGVGDIPADFFAELKGSSILLFDEG